MACSRRKYWVLLGSLVLTLLVSGAGYDSVIHLTPKRMVEARRSREDSFLTVSYKDWLQTILSILITQETILSIPITQEASHNTLFTKLFPSHYPKMTYDSTITIINQTGIAMTLGTFTADYGDWSVSPTDIASTNPTSMTFTVTADSTSK